MISVTITSNTARKSVIVPVESTIKAALDEANINVGNAAVHLDGERIRDIEQTFAENEIEDDTTCVLAVIVKADSAR